MTDDKSSNPSFSDLYNFVERVATYFDYTHDDVDELAVLRDLQNEAKRLWKPDWRPVETSESERARLAAQGLQAIANKDARYKLGHYCAEEAMRQIGEVLKALLDHRLLDETTDECQVCVSVAVDGTKNWVRGRILPRGDKLVMLDDGTRGVWPNERVKVSVGTSEPQTEAPDSYITGP